MHAFHVHYRNTQGTLMRILTAISRRAINMPYVQAAPHGCNYRVVLLLDVNPKQVGQLFRDWRAIVDVVDVLTGVPTDDMMKLAENWDAAGHPPASAAAAACARAAMA